MSPQIIRRRVLLGGAVSALAFTPSRTVQADTTFENFGFAATGAPMLGPCRIASVTSSTSRIGAQRVMVSTMIRRPFKTRSTNASRQLVGNSRAARSSFLPVDMSLLPATIWSSVRPIQTRGCSCSARVSSMAAPSLVITVDRAELPPGELSVQ